MKKILCAMALALTVATARAQNYSDERANFSVEKNGGAGASSSTDVGPYSGTPVLGDIIYFNGTNWISLAKPADGDYALRFTSSVPSYTAAAGGAPSSAKYITQTADATLSAEQALGSLATGFMKSTTTTGVVSTQTAIVLTTDVSGTLPVTSGGTGVATATAHGVMIGEGTSAQATTGAGTAGQVLISGGSGADPTFDRCVPSPTMVCVFDDFSTVTATNNAANSGTFFRCVIGGTASGCNVSVSSGATDANNYGVWATTTGTTTTGEARITGAGDAAGSSATTGGLFVSGGEVLQARIYVPTASDGTNTFDTCMAFQNAGSVIDQLAICWDNNSDTHWVINAIKNSVSTSTLRVASNTVATAAAWHTLKIVVNSNATSVAYFVDGVELNVSPLTTNIPTTHATVLVPLKVTSSASTNPKIANIDYALFMKAVTR